MTKELKIENAKQDGKSVGDGMAVYRQVVKTSRQSERPLRIEVTGSCGHTKVVRVERRAGDLFRCLACKGGYNVGGSNVPAEKAAKAKAPKAPKPGTAGSVKPAPKAKAAKAPATATAGK